MKSSFHLADPSSKSFTLVDNGLTHFVLALCGKSFCELAS